MMSGSQIILQNIKKVLPGSLEGEVKRREVKIFRNLFAEHILILPGNLKRGEKGQNLQIFLTEHIKFCQEAWNRKTSQIFPKFSCRTRIF